MKFDVLHNFISPVTGKIKVPKGNLILGNDDDIGDYVTNIDISNLPILGAANITLPNIEPTLIPNPMFKPSSLDWSASSPWLLETFTGNPDSLDPLKSKTIKSNEVAGLHIAIAKLTKQFDNANIIVKSKTFDFTWDNPAVDLLPQQVKDALNLNNSFTFTKAQALDELDDGYMINTAGIISTTSTVPLPRLLNKNIWIGDADNKAVASPNITIDNLPNLGTASITVPNPFNPKAPITISGGKIWHGTDSNRPEETTALLTVEADVALLNGRFLLGNFIMWDAVVQVAWPGAQFLSNLDNGLLKKTQTKVERAEPGVDYVDVTDQMPAEGFLPILFPDNKLLRRSTMRVVEDNRLDQIESIIANIITGNTTIQTPGTISATASVSSRMISIYDYWNGAGRLDRTFSLKGVDRFEQSFTYVVPAKPGTTGQFLKDIGANVLGERLLGFGNVLSTNVEDGLLAQGRDADDNPIIVNAKLTKGKVWQGNENNKPQEVELHVAPNDATFILQTPNQSLSKAQSLSELSGGILKSAVTTGVISIASGGKTPLTNDYVRPFDLQEEIQATRAFATAEVAAIAAAKLNLDLEMVPFLPILGVTYGFQISASVAAAAAVGAAAQVTANGANTRIDNLTVELQGDITGKGNIANPVITEFTPNPKFKGKSYVKITTGSTAERPGIAEAGMLRFNTDL